MNDQTYDLLQIDAHQHARGWAQMERVAIAQVPRALRDLQPRAVLAWLRAHGFLLASSKGKLVVEDDGYSIVITIRSTGEPLLAIEYGAQS